jgi:hypothetical protein
MPNYLQVPGQTGGAAIANDNWHIEIYAHPDRGLTLEIRMANTGVPAAIAPITATADGIHVGPFAHGELQRLPPRLVQERARKFAQEAIV